MTNSLPFYVVFSPEGFKIGRAPGAGKFQIHLVGDFEVPSCIDLECGEVGEQVTRRGGHLSLAGDSKAVRNLDIPYWHNDRRWVAETNLLVVTNSNGLISAIYRDARLVDVPRVLRELRL